MSRKKRRKPEDRTPTELLADLAGVLNACEAGQVRIKVRHGALFSRYGCILPPHGKSGWQAKIFGRLPMAPAEDQDGDGMDD